MHYGQHTQQHVCEFMAPAYAPLPHASLDLSKHLFVNAFLKSLNLRVHMIDALFMQHATELALLE